MDTLLIRLIGPQQAWGVQSAGENRDTGREPSKSGVIGLLCAALGRPREESLEDLNSLRMGVRVDREGLLECDFQTIHRINWEGESSQGSISTRFYLSGAVFLVGLEGDLALLERLQDALMHPHWLLYLGRKAFPPSSPIHLPDGLRKEQALEDALRTYPWLPYDLSENDETVQNNGPVVDLPATLRIVLEDPQGELIRMDSPVTFSDRHFLSRRVRVGRIVNPSARVKNEEA